MRLLKMVSGITVALGLALTAALAQGAQNEQGETTQQRERGMKQGDIVTRVKESGQFNTLTQALEQSGLARELQRGGPYTIFAPTDAAFEKLGKKKVDDLMKPENKSQLAKILKYHVIRGEVTPAKVSGKEHAQTLEGQRVTIDAKGGRLVQVNRAKVTEPDIKAQNGLIYPVDEVLMPRG